MEFVKILFIRTRHSFSFNLIEKIKPGFVRALTVLKNRCKVACDGEVIAFYLAFNFNSNMIELFLLF